MSVENPVGVKVNKLQFKIVRSLMGAYFLYFWIPLLNYSDFLFGKSGVFQDTPRLLLPSIFETSLSPSLIIIFMALNALLLFLGLLPKIATGFLWIGFVSFINYIPYLKWPSEGLIGWILLFFLFVPQSLINDRIKIEDKKHQLELPPYLMMGALIVLGFLYSVSGWNKFDSPSWISGLGINLSLQNSFSNANWLTGLVLLLPLGIQKFIGWFFLAAEIICLPAFLLSNFTKKYIWLSLFLMHMGIFLMVNIWIVTVPMLIMHLLVLDLKWFEAEINFLKKITK